LSIDAVRDVAEVDLADTATPKVDPVMSLMAHVSPHRSVVLPSVSSTALVVQLEPGARSVLPIVPPFTRRIFSV